MKIATVLFTFQRSIHTKKVLDSLQKNERRPDKLLIFQDGLSDKSDDDKWKEVNQTIQNVDWCDCDVIVSDRNKGLADSIVDGLDYVFRHYDAAIVLEDDCVVHSQFMTYMTESLVKYEMQKEIFSVSGYAWPVEVEKNGYDAYFTQRISSWGWGTWKDRWGFFKRDYRLLSRVKSTPELAERLYNWGRDLEQQLLGNVLGKYNSWAVFWALSVIEQNGYCLAPYESLVDNIGFDGTGEHCGTGKIESRLRKEDNRKEIHYPDKVTITEKTKAAFADYFSWTPLETKLLCYFQILAEWVKRLHKGESIGTMFLKNGIRKISIWGKGRLCDLILEELSDRVEVVSIIESKPDVSSYKGIPVVTADKLSDESQKVVVMPVYDMERIMLQVDEKYQDRLLGMDVMFEGMEK